MKKTEQLNKKKIMEIIESHKYHIQKYGVKKLGLFGSYAKNNHKKHSDIDFLVVLDKPTFDNYMGLKFMLEKVLHKKIDLVIEQNIKPALKYIKEEAVYAKGL